MDRVDGTYTGCSAKIQQNLALFQKSILLVQLDKLERSTGAVSLLLGETIPLIQTSLTMLFWSQ